MRSLLSVLAAIIASLILIGASPAEATTYYVKFCFILDLDYEDWTDGDYWTEGYNVHAKGIRARVTRNPDNFEMFAGYTTNTGTACTPQLPLSPDYTYRVLLKSYARDANYNVVHVYTGWQGTTHHQQTVDTAYHPTANATEYYLYEIINAEHETNVLAAASYAVAKNPAGISNRDDFVFHNHTEDDEHVGAHTHSDGIVVLDPYAKNRKTGTTHELGHVVGYMRNGNQLGFGNYSDVGGGQCTSTDEGHEAYSREWQTAAAVEGIAHFYAALTWNDDTDDDCEYRGSDCVHDGYLPIDWLSHCPTPRDNRGNEWDWLRFWWDLHTLEGVSVTDIFDIWNGANPEDWTAPCVYSRLGNAAVFQGISTETWDYWGDWHGVNHGSC
jgi:hypothetical protein